MTREQVKDYLNNLAKEVAENRTFTATGQVNKSKMNKATFINRLLTEEKVDMYEVMTGAPKTIKVDGKECKVIIEAANEDKLNSFAKGSSATEVECAIAVDDQYFWDGVSSEVTVPVQLVYDENSGIPVETQYWTLPYASDINDIEEDFNNAIAARLASLEFPMFILTIENNLEELEMEKTAGLNKPTAAGYLVLKGIRLRTERDGWSHEEFELWYGGPVIPSNTKPVIYQCWKMNGVTRLDASGTQRYFSDVNKAHKWYADQGWDVRLLALGDDNKAMVAWEDDWNEGQIDRRCLVPNLSYIRPGQTNVRHVRASTKNYDAWDLSTNKIDPNVDLATEIDGAWLPTIDEDDSFSQSAVYKITNNNVRDRSQNGTYTFHSADAVNVPGGLGDIYYRFAWSGN